MQRKPPYTLPTQQTQDCSSQEIPRNHFINSLDQANIIDVWADNFHQEIDKISILTKKYNFIAIDTQFPSIEEYNQKSSYLTQSEHQKYYRLTKNVDNTTLIQLGLCLADQDGNVPGQKFCWQFNFKFQSNIEEISSPSAFLLKKAGINFQRLQHQGISYKTFTHEFIKSGLLLNKHNKWIVFHGGYDFSYLLKLIRNQSLPKLSQQFYKSIKIYFPQKIDLKLLIQKQKRFKKLGLSKLADAILCRRIGPEHQAGSDALLTLQCYFKLRQQFQYIMNEVAQIENQIFGISNKQLQKYELNYNFEQIKANGYYQQNALNMGSTNFMYYNYPYNEMIFNQSLRMYTNQFGSYYYYPTANDKRYDNKTQEG